MANKNDGGWFLQGMLQQAFRRGFAYGAGIAMVLAVLTLGAILYFVG